MGKRISFEPGQTIEVPNYPFVRFVFHGCDIDGPFSDDGWCVNCHPYGGTEAIRELLIQPALRED